MTTVKELGQIIVGAPGITSTVANRFNRLLGFYEGSGNDVDIVDVLVRIVESPDEFKKTEELLSRWTTPNSVGDMYSSIIKVLEVGGVKDAIVARGGGADTGMGFYDRVKEAHKAYLKEVVAAAEAKAAGNVKTLVLQEPPATATVAPVQGATAAAKGRKVKSQSQGSVKAVSVVHEIAGSDGGEDDEEDDYTVDLEGFAYEPPSRQQQQSAILVEQMTEMHERMSMYAKVLKKIDNPVVAAVVEMLEFDLDKWSKQ